jgi:hypothetical protein
MFPPDPAPLLRSAYPVAPGERRALALRMVLPSAPMTEVTRERAMFSAG